LFDPYSTIMTHNTSFLNAVQRAGASVDCSHRVASVGPEKSSEKETGDEKRTKKKEEEFKVPSDNSEVNKSSS